MTCACGPMRVATAETTCAPSEASRGAAQTGWSTYAVPWLVTWSCVTLTEMWSTPWVANTACGPTAVAARPPSRNGSSVYSSRAVAYWKAGSPTAAPDASRGWTRMSPVCPSVYATNRWSGVITRAGTPTSPMSSPVTRTGSSQVTPRSRERRSISRWVATCGPRCAQAAHRVPSGSMASAWRAASGSSDAETRTGSLHDDAGVIGPADSQHAPETLDVLAGHQEDARPVAHEVAVPGVTRDVGRGRRRPSVGRGVHAGRRPVATRGAARRRVDAAGQEAGHQDRDRHDHDDRGDRPPRPGSGRQLARRRRGRPSSRRAGVLRSCPQSRDAAAGRPWAIGPGLPAGRGGPGQVPASRSTTGASSSTPPTMIEVMPSRSRSDSNFSTNRSIDPMNRCGESSTSASVSSMPVRPLR